VLQSGFDATNATILIAGNVSIPDSDLLSLSSSELIVSSSLDLQSNSVLQLNSYSKISIGGNLTFGANSRLDLVGDRVLQPISVSGCIDFGGATVVVNLGNASLLKEGQSSIPIAQSLSKCSAGFSTIEVATTSDDPCVRYQGTGDTVSTLATTRFNVIVNVDLMCLVAGQPLLRGFSPIEILTFLLILL